MKQSQYIKLQEWFEDFVNSYYSEDAVLNENIRLKHVHTHKVCDEMEYLCDSIELPQSQKNVALTIALLHDVGRFEQLRQYKTFNDRISVKHADLSVETIKRLDILGDLEDDERTIIETAILCHSDKELNLPKELAFVEPFAHLIRDADKIDIYRVIVESYRKYQENPESCGIAIGFMEDGDQKCSPEVVKCLLNRQTVTYELLKNQNDRKLLQINWVYQMHYDPALTRILERGYIDLFFDNLPTNPEIIRIHQCISEYIAQRLGTKIVLQPLSA